MMFGLSFIDLVVIMLYFGVMLESATVDEKNKEPGRFFHGWKSFRQGAGRYLPCSVPVPLPTVRWVRREILL